MTHHKTNRFARDKLKDPSGSQSDESSQLPSDKTLPRAGEIDRAAMKRKEPHFQVEKSPTNVSRLPVSYQKKVSERRSSNRYGASAKPRKSNQSAVGNTLKALGQNKGKGPFVFSSSAGPSVTVGLNQNQKPLSPSHTNSPFTRPGSKGNEGISHSLGLSNNGESREVGDVLQKQNRTDRRRDDQMDPTRPNRDLGVVRLGADACLEEYVPTDGGEQGNGLPPFDEHSMGVDSESVVEIYHGQASVPCPTTIKLKLAGDRIKHAALGKITDRSRKELVEPDDLGEEDPSRQACGMLYEGESTQDEDDPVCESQERENPTHQDLNRRDGYCSPLDQSVPRVSGEESRGNGSMDIEGH